MNLHTGIYEQIQNRYHFTDLEMKRMHYTLSVLFYELSKFVILAIIFGICGFWAEYWIIMGTLIPIRILGGGLHFNHYLSCFLFTACFVVCPVLLRSICLSCGAHFFTLLGCMILTYAIGPVTSKKRPPISRQRFALSRLITSSLILCHIVIFVLDRTIPGLNICFWVIVLQTIQLICAKMVRKGEIYETE